MPGCPVCGYTGFKSPPDLGMTCPCCGTEFGFHDELKTHQELRAQWVQGGMLWWSQNRKQPDGWDSRTQLNNLFLREAEKLRSDISSMTDEAEQMLRRLTSLEEGLKSIASQAKTVP